MLVDLTEPLMIITISQHVSSKLQKYFCLTDALQALGFAQTLAVCEVSRRFQVCGVSETTPLALFILGW